MVGSIDWSLLAAALTFGYFCGSIPFGVLLTRLAGAGDVRSIGSGNIGATNVLRTGRKGLAAATLLGDALKGTFAVLFIKYVLDDPYLPLAAGLGAFLGHLYPCWLGFKGGKGVATYIGILLGLAWPAAIVFCLIWLVVAAVCRYSSLAGLAPDRRPASGRAPVRAAHGRALVAPSRKHRAPAPGHRGQDRPEVARS
jgi:glycerol-3-phosphate acyltransferase PlsY